MKLINFLKSRFRKYLNEETWLKDYVKMGMKIGSNCAIQPGLIVDYSHCWLIEIGNNVTIAPQVYLLAHDASTKRHLNVTKLGKVVLKDNAFIGARAVIMPNVIVGENAIVAAGSIVTTNVAANTVVGGNPAKFICTLEDYLTKQKELLKISPTFDASFGIETITEDQKKQMNKELDDKIGFI